ncbi:MULTISPECIES: peptide chain release factor N(5)-glutamine methyltransferase [unclassified Rathayibacter]|uniref:peptide chain release factor N(5)-glutamine methyltransferase n=1 Tax=unclassified Rathayibacter TaxID=2609250 RepID=UPI000CE8B28A|nr:MULTISPECIES: peptide chain release factor N(5)-glutamine methyltransferase [unclassified Rathayibacter]PPF20241.1 peptide chain release factor N(5)-glutamine methyltransferase [Rathayibacter sp. AY1A4]PPG83720.1 peptide chain release factor N(5)-glutamine methyltransferase [Rathayibacter sp. AY1E5]PPH34008.1 peptide chain release factor N(5)-glutamine methyltransferase [Rathayibacter sp. AY1C3]PPH62659.1 peptide chain release factor N(5)-glutamine methyltransferase [Rathayibacter sp. AY1D7]
MTLVTTGVDARTLLADAVARLAAARVHTPDVDAELLLGHLLGLGRGRLQARLITGLSVDEEHAAAFASAIERRSAREPLQHITGIAPFRSLELAVGPGVFVPRPETEGVAQIAIDALRAVVDPEPIAVDLGTGSGALALALAHEVPHARVIGVENAPEAFIWARGNRERLGLENARIVFDDLARALPELDGTVSVVVSNPPYIPAAAVPRDPEVRLFDPPSALYGGEDGLDVVRSLSATALRLLRSGGVLVMEHGELQGAEIRALLTADGWRGATTQRDLTGRDRATVAVR